MLNNLFYIDQLSILMIIIISVVGTSVICFSTRYLEGDALYNKFFLNIILLIISVLLISISDHIVLFLIVWGISNFLLVNLMIYKRSWDASLQSGLIAKKYFIFSFLMISSGLLLLSYSSGTTSINKIINAEYEQNILNISLLLLLLGAMAQSSIWPFHKWLISSLNSPTPVSAIMHAGLVNGGGFLLARFSLLYISSPKILDFIFMIGIFTAIIGTIWKLIQSDIKKMLACSTMGQMGFMFMQFGLGLFPAALAHLCFHSFFKAYLFLLSSSAASVKKLDSDYPPKISTFILSILCGILGILAFTFVSNKNLTNLDTNLILLLITFIISIQFSLAILSSGTLLKMIPVAVSGVICFAAFYGLSIYTIERLLEPINLFHPQAINNIHITGALLLFFLWIIMIFSNYLEKIINKYVYIQRLYVYMLNLSQPSPKTITAHRNNYNYI